MEAALSTKGERQILKKAPEVQWKGVFEVLTRFEIRERQTMGSRFEHPATAAPELADQIFDS
jgi:hypothetical protein